MRWSPRGRRLALAVALAPAALLACGDDEPTAGCGPITREALDPAYLLHVVGDDDTVAYTSDPPTSGPHQAGPPLEGVVGEPISRPLQVGILERGDVLLQHQASVAPTEVATLEALAGPGVVVAPNPGLAEPVVATAWLFKRSCTSVDTAALRQFIDERTGRGPDG